MPGRARALARTSLDADTIIAAYQEALATDPGPRSEFRHEHQSLLDAGRHATFLNAFAGLAAVAERVADLHGEHAAELSTILSPPLLNSKTKYSPALSAP